MAKYVIIGNGTAAVSAIEGIRSLDKSGSIAVISKEPKKAYCRPLISYYLEGKTDFERMNLREADFYDKNGCELYSGRTAAAIDPDKKRVVLDSGESLDYEKLLLATGSSPFVPPFKGLDLVEKKCGFMTEDDAAYLEENTDSQSRVLIVGAGLIGLKCAEGLKGRVASITVCDLAERVLSSILDSEASEMVKAHLEQNCIELLLGDTAVEFEAGKAVMKSGKTIDFDVLVLAVGVRPNTGIFAEAGGKVGRGITVNERMETSLPDVYAAGDCTESTDISSGDIKIMALMPNANMQGRCAGANMAGGQEVFDKAVPMNSIGFFGLHIMSAGSYTGERQSVKTSKGLKEFYVGDGRLKGFIIVGDTERAGIYTSLIRNGVDLSEIDFESIKAVPELYAFGENYCRNKLTGVV